MKVHEFDKLEKKLNLKTKNTHHHYAWFEYNGVTVARTKRSQGKSKYIPEDLVRKQLHVDQDQFHGLISCTVSKEDYIEILKARGIIDEPTSKRLTTGVEYRDRGTKSVSTAKTAE